MTEVFTKKDCKLDNSGELSGEWLILNVDILGEAYQSAKFQLVKCVGGFGASPSNSGRKIFVMYAADSDRSYFARDDFLGVASEKAIEEYKIKYPECAENVKKLLEEE